MLPVMVLIPIMVKLIGIADVRSPQLMNLTFGRLNLRPPVSALTSLAICGMSKLRLMNNC